MSKPPLSRMDQLMVLTGWSWTKSSPWEIHDGYCDEQGRCWFRREMDQTWILERPGNGCNSIACLPHYALRQRQGEVQP